MQRVPLKSSAIISAGYDPDERALELEYRSGHVYRYEDVPASVYEWLLRIENKGVFVRRMVAGRYVERAVAGPARPVAARDAPTLEQALRASIERLSDPD